MNPHGVSGSKVELAMLCSYFAREDIERANRPSGPSARKGTRVHKLAEAHLVPGTPNAPLENEDEEREAQKKWTTLKAWIDSNGPFQSEVGLVYDVAGDTCHDAVMGPGGERDYLGITSTMIPMRLDLLKVIGDRAGVIDIKTGSASNVQPAERNAQLLTAALAVTRRWPEVMFVQVGLVYPLVTKVNTDYSSFTRADCDVHAKALRRMMMRLPIAAPVKGSHCWVRCPIGPAKGFVSTCPVWQE